MPGQRHETLDSLCTTVEETIALGLGGVLLFGLPAAKDAQGQARLPRTARPVATRALRDDSGTRAW